MVKKRKSTHNTTTQRIILDDTRRMQLDDLCSKVQFSRLGREEFSSAASAEFKERLALFIAQYVSGSNTLSRAQPSRSKRLLGSAVEHVDRLRIQLKKIRCDEIAYRSIIVGPKEWTPNTAEAWAEHPKAQAFEENLRRLDHLSGWLKTARQIIESEKKRPGPDSNSLFFLVLSLNSAFSNFTGKELSRSDKRTLGKISPKQFVEQYCKIANLKIGTGAIDLALKKVVNWGKRFGFMHP